MRFSLVHTFDASVERVEQAVLDPAYQDRLTDLPNVAERTVVEQATKPDGTTHRVVRYGFGGELPGPVQRVVGGPSVSWDEVGIFDPDRHEWRFVIEPHVVRDKLQCSGFYRFRPGPDGRTIREVDVDLRVRVPLVGKLVERTIRDGLVETLNAEANVLGDYLREAAA